MNLTFDVYNWRPTLRGSEAESQNDQSYARVGVYCDGTIRYECVRDVLAVGHRPYLLHPAWYFALVVNAVEAAEKFRTAAGAASSRVRA